jgi:hypothetical protein
MAMTYTSLSAAKGVAGSLKNWVSYSLLDVTTIIDEAQALVYSALRCREMLTSMQFTMSVGGASFALPARFLDPIGRMRFTGFNLPVRHKDSSFVETNRNYTELSGTLGTNPFTTVSGSNVVTVNLTGHGFSQDSIINTSGATIFNGVIINGTFQVTSIVDANNFTIDITVLGTTPSAGGAGGGSAVAYIIDNLVQGMPVCWGIWDEAIHFDTAFTQVSLGRLQYYQSLPLLSVTNQSNFLTNRYPQLMRRACVAAAADFMKDDQEYQKDFTALQGIVQQINIENDMGMRGMELDTETP